MLASGLCFILVRGLRVGQAPGARISVAAADEMRIGLGGQMSVLVVGLVAVGVAAVVVDGVEVAVAARGVRAVGIDRVIGAVEAAGVVGAAGIAGPVTVRGETGSRAMGGQPAQGAGSSSSSRSNGLRGLRCGLSGGCRSPRAVRSGLSQRRGNRGGGSPVGSDRAEVAGCPSSAAIRQASGAESADGAVRPSDVWRHGVRGRGGGSEARAEGIRPGAARGACGRGVGGGAKRPCGVGGAASACDADRRSSPRREGASEDGGRGASRATDRAREAAQTGWWAYRAVRAPGSGGAPLSAAPGRTAVVAEWSTTALGPLAGEDEALVVCRDALLALNLLLQVGDGIGLARVERDHFARQRLHEDLSASAEA